MGCLAYTVLCAYGDWWHTILTANGDSIASLGGWRETAEMADCSS